MSGEQIGTESLTAHVEMSQRGAAMQNLSRSASFHSMEQNAPLNTGTKHLV